MDANVEEVETTSDLNDCKQDERVGYDDADSSETVGDMDDDAESDTESCSSACFTTMPECILDDDEEVWSW